MHEGGGADSTVTTHEVLPDPGSPVSRIVHPSSPSPRALALASPSGLGRASARRARVWSSRRRCTESHRGAPNAEKCRLITRPYRAHYRRLLHYQTQTHMLQAAWWQLRTAYRPPASAQPRQCVASQRPQLQQRAHGWQTSHRRASYAVAGRQARAATSCQPTAAKSCAHERMRQWVSQAASIAADAGHHG